MGRIYSIEEKKFKKSIITISAILSLAIPFLSSVVLGGSELVIYYFSALGSSGAGLIVAQVISIARSAVYFASFMASLALMGGSLVSFGPKNSGAVCLMTLCSPVLSSFFSLVTVYFLVIAGLHDYTLSMLHERMPALIITAAFSSLTLILLAVAALILFCLRPKLHVGMFSSDADFLKSLKIILSVSGIIRLFSLVYDTLSTGIDFSSVNGVVSGLIVPVLTPAFEIAGAYFAIRFILSAMDSCVKKSGVRLGKRRSVI